MPTDFENYRAITDIINSIVTPMNQSLARHTEAINMTGNIVQRLVEAAGAEPTRLTIIEELKKELNSLNEKYKDDLEDHDKCCKERNTALYNANTKKIEEDLKEIIVKMKEIIDAHQVSIDDRLDPIRKLTKRFNWLLTAIGLSWAIAGGFYAYFYPIIESLKKGVH